MRLSLPLAGCTLVASLALAQTTACLHAGPTPAGGDAAGTPGSPCMETADCVAGLCAFPIEAGCSAQGVCVTEDFTCTMDGPVVCACSGDPVQLACIYGPGNAPLPVPSVNPGCQPDAGLFD
jgi:hypothetical protein